MDADTATGESTGQEPVFRNCRHCGQPVQQPTRRGQVKEFCSDRHRAAFRDAQIQAGIREAQAAIRDTRQALSDTRDELERLDARLVAADQLLERGLRHGTRPRKTAEPKPVDPAAELLKDLRADLEEKK